MVGKPLKTLRSFKILSLRDFIPGSWRPPL